jgi:hypothetical protein
MPLKLPSDGGMLPVKELSSKARYTKLAQSPSVLGISPDKLFFDRSELAIFF